MAIVPRYIQNLDGSTDANTVMVKVDVNQTINVGDMLQIESSTGLAEVAVAASTTMIGIAADSITTGGSVTAQDVIPVISFRDGVFRMPYTGGPPTDASLYNVLYDISNKTTVNLGDTSNGMFRVKAYNTTLGTVDVYTNAGLL